jgi:hypothetical protein
MERDNVNRRNADRDKPLSLRFKLPLVEARRYFIKYSNNRCYRQDILKGSNLRYNMYVQGHSNSFHNSYILKKDKCCHNR